MINVPFLKPEERFNLGGREWTALEVAQSLRPWITPERAAKIDRVVTQRRLGIATVMDSIYDQGNQSAVIRSAEGLGFPWVHIIETGEKTKEANRVTLGADKWMEIQRWKNPRDCIRVLKHYGFKIVSTDLQATTTIEALDLSTPTAFVFGNEKLGVSEEILKASDERVCFPMNGFTQSFNISVAAALFLARARAALPEPDMTDRQADVLRAHYYLRSIPTAELILRAQVKTYVQRYGSSSASLAGAGSSLSVVPETPNDSASPLS